MRKNSFHLKKLDEIEKVRETQRFRLRKGATIKCIFSRLNDVF
jgi:hypothetical protein